MRYHQRGEDDDFGAHGVDVLRVPREGGEGERAPPEGGEAGGEGVEDAGCEGEGFEGEVGVREEGVAEGGGGGEEGGGAGDEVGEVGCWAWGWLAWVLADWERVGGKYLVNWCLGSCRMGYWGMVRVGWRCVMRAEAWESRRGERRCGNSTRSRSRSQNRMRRRGNSHAGA